MKYKIPKTVLFVCTGNTCRSPMAEYLARELFEREGLEIKVGSRGLKIYDSSVCLLGAERSACYAVRELFPGNQIFIHEPTSLSLKDIVIYDLILTMEERHRRDIMNDASEFIPGLEQRVFTLKELVNIEEAKSEDDMNIRDPINEGCYYLPQIGVGGKHTTYDAAKAYIYIQNVGTK